MTLPASRPTRLSSNLFEGVTAPGGATGAVDQAMGGAHHQLIASGDIRGKRGEMTLVHTWASCLSPRVVVAGLGKQDDFDIDKVRDLAGDAGALSAPPAHLKTPPPSRTAPASPASTRRPAPQAIAEGTLLGALPLPAPQEGRRRRRRRCESLTIVEQRRLRSSRPWSAASSAGAILAEATNFCRDLANEPANYLTPTELADAAPQEMAARDRPRVRDLRPGLDRREGHGRLPRRRAPAACRSRASSSCATTAPATRAPARRSSARASPSTPAASRSSRPQAWAR